MLDESIANQTSECIEGKVTVLNSVQCFSFSHFFRLKKLSKKSIRVIERWFTTVADSENFLELDFPLVAAVLDSSELLIDSELQVFNVVNAWLNQKSVDRIKHATYLLQRVRLSLLTVPALNNILNENLWVVMNDDCSEVIKKVIRHKTEFPFKCNNALPTSRYCSQDSFKFIISGGKRGCKIVKSAFTVDCTDVARVANLPISNYRRQSSKIVCIKGEIYVFGGNGKKNKRRKFVEKYSPALNSWDVIAKMHDVRREFCACSFVDNVYCIGGSDLTHETNSCVVFNTKNHTWNIVARMKQRRSKSSCTVFEGRIVVTGGFNRNIGRLNTVEAYDHIDNSWSKMPNMVESRADHKSVTIKNKLYLVRSLLKSDVEVFDSFSHKFVLLKCPRNLSRYIISDVTTIGNKLVIFTGLDYV